VGGGVQQTAEAESIATLPPPTVMTCVARGKIVRLHEVAARETGAGAFSSGGFRSVETIFAFSVVTEHDPPEESSGSHGVSGVGANINDDSLISAIRAFVWTPEYTDYEPA
jgi:hypothetical protein